jgi:hypothetical protein
VFPHVFQPVIKRCGTDLILSYWPDSGFPDVREGAPSGAIRTEEGEKGGSEDWSGKVRPEPQGMQRFVV